jgi:2',3'-cyclic-nucleotide 2'-phosphodiesterase (5'-nucleotidase family)
MHLGNKLAVTLQAVSGALVGSFASAQQTTTVKIIAFNDFHANLQSPGNFIGVPAGGADVLAGYVAKLKGQNPYNVTVHAGDMSGASPLISAFFYDEPAIESMNRLGVDFASVGNHEFDFGKTELLRKQNGGCSPPDPSGQKLTCQGASVGTPVPFEGAKFKYLAANVLDTASNQTLFPPYAIKTFTTPAGRVRLAFIGMTLQATPTIVTPTGVAGLNFTDEATTVNALVPRLHALGAQAIVVVVHQGGFNSGDISKCPGDAGNTDTTNPAGLAGSDIAKIVNRLDDAVDLVVSAHTHNAYICQVPNAVGRLVTLTLTGQQIKDALEQQFNGCSIEGLPPQAGGTKILLVSNGFNYSWDATRALCDRVVSISLNGSPIYGNGANVSQTYRVTVNNFLSTGGDNFTVFKSGTDLVGGSQDIDALVNYMPGFKLPDFPAYDPAAFPPRITRLDPGTTIP